MKKDQKVFIVGLCGGQGGKNNIIKSSSQKYSKQCNNITKKRKLSAGDEPLVGEFGGYSKNRKL